MARAKPFASNPVHEMLVSEVHFLGEQDGPPEKLLKEKLIGFFERDNSVERAYLARMALQGERNVALCLKTQFGADKALAEKIGVIFGMIFNAREHLDIIFLSEQQESRLRQVCPAFFGRNQS